MYVKVHVTQELIDADRHDPNIGSGRTRHCAIARAIRAAGYPDARVGMAAVQLAPGAPCIMLPREAAIMRQQLDDRRGQPWPLPDPVQPLTFALQVPDAFAENADTIDILPDKAE